MRDSANGPTADNAAAPAAGDSSPTPAQGRELRRHPRHAWMAEINICWVFRGSGRSRPFWTKCRDISAGGMGFYTRGLIQRGTEGVALMTPKDRRPFLQCFRVLHCRYAIDEGAYLCGAEWVHGAANAGGEESASWASMDKFRIVVDPAHGVALEAA